LVVLLRQTKNTKVGLDVHQKNGDTLKQPLKEKVEVKLNNVVSVIILFFSLPSISEADVIHWKSGLECLRIGPAPEPEPEVESGQHFVSERRLRSRPPASTQQGQS
jgi:hypothetical protein